MAMSTTTISQPTPAHQLHNSQSQAAASVGKDLTIPRGSVTVSLPFFSPPEDGSVPHNYDRDHIPAGKPQRNYADQDHDVTLSDLRGQESSFNLDHHAFAALKNVPSAMKYEDWKSDETIRKVYYPEAEKLLLDNLPGSSKVVIWTHTVRGPGNRAPVVWVHMDQTTTSTVEIARRQLGDEAAEEALKGRYRIVNVWQTINGPLYASPLAVADSATVADDHLISIEYRYADRKSEIASLKYGESQKWYYWSGMEDDERLLLKCYDSDEVAGHKGRVAHSSFVDPRTPEGAPARESIELRALVLG